MSIIGIDEVGRGCWAGPLVVGAVMLRAKVNGLSDSKLLSARRRTELDRLIRTHAAYVGLGWVHAEELDRLGMRQALQTATQRAISQLAVIPDRIVIDGNVNFLPDFPQVELVIKADQTVPAVSAASIVAKVARDNFMIDLARQLPGYGFETNVGYGTALHRSALLSLGLSDYHRLSFNPMKSMLH